MPPTLRIAGYQDARSVHSRAVRVLEAALKPGAAVDFLENIATTGRKVIDLLDMVEAGELDLCYFSSSYLTARVPALGVFDIPFLLTDRDRTRALLQGALGQRLAAEIGSRTGYTVLGFWDNGPRNISNRLRAIRMPADCRASASAHSRAPATTPRIARSAWSPSPSTSAISSRRSQAARSTRRKIR